MRAFPLLAALSLLIALEIAAQPLSSATDLMAEAKFKAVAEHKNIFIRFGSSACGWCRKLDKILEVEEVHQVFEKYFVPVTLVVMENDETKINPGGKELLEQLGGLRSGLPFFAFVDSEGKMIVSSNTDGKSGNIGCPATKAEIEWFLKMIRKAAPDVTDTELKAIEDVLNKPKR